MPALLRAPAPLARRSARWLRTAALACAPVIAAACGDSITNPSDIAGTYALVAVQGQSLPFTYNAGGYTTIVTDGQLFLNDDGTYRVQSYSRVVDQQSGVAESETDTDTGEYTLNGDYLTFRSDTGADRTFASSASGRVSGSTVTFDVFTFVRR